MSTRTTSFTQSVNAKLSLTDTSFFKCFCGSGSGLYPLSSQFKAVKFEKVIVDGEEVEKTPLTSPEV